MNPYDLLTLRERIGIVALIVIVAVYAWFVSVPAIILVPLLVGPVIVLVVGLKWYRSR